MGVRYGWNILVSLLSENYLGAKSDKIEEISRKFYSEPPGIVLVILFPACHLEQNQHILIDFRNAPLIFY